MRYKTEKTSGGILVNGQYLSYKKRSGSAINEYKSYLERQAKKQREIYGGKTFAEMLNEKKKMYERLKLGEITHEELREWRHTYGI